MKKFLKKILGIVIVLFIFFSIAFILTLPFSILLSAFKCFLGNNYHGIFSFWEINFFFSFFTLIMICCLLEKYETNKTNKEEDETMKTPKIDDTDLNEIDDTDLNTYSDKDVWVARKNFNSEKQFCYDSLNPCPYCDTKFEHTALHCAVYFSDMERLKEVIELIKKVDGVDDYYFGLSGIFCEIFHKKDFRCQTSLILAAEIGSLEIIKLLLQCTKERPVKLEIYSGNNEYMYVNSDEEETLNRLIDSFQYKKKTQTGKDILDKDDKNPLSKSFSKSPH